MSNFEIHIHNRDYGEWEYKTLSGDKIDQTIIDITPIEYKMFHLDTYMYENGNIILDTSSVRNMPCMPGVLLIQDGRTYGRTENKKRLLYRCIPDDKHLPEFLLPYEIQLGFEKNIHNKYVLFRYDHWNHKHPRGIITETLGNVSNLDAYYEYRMHCYRVYHSNSAISSATRRLFSGKGDDEITEIAHNNPHYKIVDRRGRNIISIDPIGSRDFDDAFGIDPRYNSCSEQIGWTVSVYIANVFLFLEHFNLWSILSERVSTIYLPSSKRPILPTRLSDDLCSLIEGKPRLAFAMDLHISMEGVLDINSVSFTNAIIQVQKNYVYEESFLKKNKMYRNLRVLTKRMDQDICDSHGVVEYWMIKMNTLSGEYLIQHKTGVYRAVQYNPTGNTVPVVEHNLDDETNRTLRSWNNTNCRYALYSEDTDSILHNMIDVRSYREMDNHQLMKKQPYVHITSPIRRLVDVLNQIMLTLSSEMVGRVSDNAKTFLDKWTTRMDLLNSDMKAIRKIQTESKLLHECTYNQDIVDKIHNGVVFGKSECVGGGFKYMVYLHSIRLMSPVYTIEDLTEYTIHKFQIYVFHDAATVVRKVRLQLNN